MGEHRTEKTVETDLQSRSVDHDLAAEVSVMTVAREESDRRFADKIRADFRNARGEHGVEEPEQLATLDSDPAKQALKKAAAYRRLLMMTLRLLSAAERRAKYRRDQDS